MSSIRYVRIALLIAVGALLSTSCSLPKYATVNTLQQPTYSLGSSPQVIITEAKGGRRNLQDAVIEQLVAQSRRRGYFVIANKISEGIRFDIRQNSIVTSPMPPKGEYFLRFDLLDNDVTEGVEQRRTGLLGEKIVEVEVVRAKVGVSFTLAGTSLVIEQKEIDGQRSWDKGREPKERSTMLEGAVANAVEQFLDLITPKSVRYDIRLDDSDKSHKEAINLARSGNFKAALELFEKYAAAAPTSAAAMYNMAVMHDALGNYQEALSLYEKAETIGQKKFYSEAKAGCLTRSQQR